MASGDIVDVLDLVSVILAWEGFHERYPTREEVVAEFKALIIKLRELKKFDGEHQSQSGITDRGRLSS